MPSGLEHKGPEQNFIACPRLIVSIFHGQYRNANMQGEFSFDDWKPEDGFVKWVTGRRLLAEELARQIHLPLGHRVEVWLYGGIRLRGKLRLKEELLFIEADQARHLELLVDNVSFAIREMESCVRLD